MTELVPPPWDERSRTPAAMFNPALTATTIAAAANQYEHTTGFALPWTLSFLVTPLVLHRPTREALPKTSRASLSKWITDLPVLSAGFPARARTMAPFVREGIQFGLREGILEMVNDDRFRADTLPKRPKSVGDLGSIVRSAGMVGRLFGKAGSAANIYATLRVQP